MKRANKIDYSKHFVARKMTSYIYITQYNNCAVRKRSYLYMDAFEVVNEKKAFLSLITRH